MKVPSVETFGQSLPERQDGDQPNGRERSKRATGSGTTDDVLISNGARTLHQRKTLTENVVGKVALRTLNRELDDLPHADRKPRSASIPHVTRNEAPSRLSGHDTALEILDRIRHSILAAFRESHPEPSVEELARLRIDVVHGFEEGLAAARAELAHAGVLSEELENAIAELENRVREGLGNLFASPADA